GINVVLDMLRCYVGYDATGYVIEYFGEVLKNLTTMDRHVIANMGTEMGATTTVFPADEEIHRFMKSQGRGDEFTELVADEGAEYDKYEELILDDVIPLIALPSSPGNVVPVREVEGRNIYQAYVGSSANPGYRDFWMAGEIVSGETVNDNVSWDINPTSRQIIENMVKNDVMFKLVQSGDHKSTRLNSSHVSSSYAVFCLNK